MTKIPIVDKHKFLGIISDEKKILTFVLHMAAWILGCSGMKNFKKTYATHWLNIPLSTCDVSLLNFGVGSVSALQNFCGLHYIQSLNKEQSITTEYHDNKVF